MANEVSPSSDTCIHTLNEKLHIYKFISEFVIYFVVWSVWEKYNNYYTRRCVKDSRLLLRFQFILVY